MLLSLFSGERLTAYRAIGIVAALLGVLLVAAAEKSAVEVEQQAKSKTFAGIGWALVAALLFGILFWLWAFESFPEPALWLPCG